MKKKSKNARLKRKNEFRFHKVEKKTKRGRIRKIMHPSYIFLEKGNVYIYVTITHSKEVEGYVLTKLIQNPDPSDNQDAYVVLDVRQDIKSSFGARRIGWFIVKDDENLIRKLFDDQKEKDGSPSTSDDESSR